jgi:hypothetical protein
MKLFKRKLFKKAEVLLTDCQCLLVEHKKYLRELEQRIEELEWRLSNPVKFKKGDKFDKERMVIDFEVSRIRKFVQIEPGREQGKTFFYYKYKLVNIKTGEISHDFTTVGKITIP